MLLKVGITAVTLMLVACGGGGVGGVSGNNTPQPTAQDLANAKAAAVVGSFDLTNHMIMLAWTDAFATGTGFQIEQQQADGSWSKIDSVPGPSGSTTALTWTRAVNATSNFRIEAVLSSYNVLLQTASGQQNIIVTPPNTPPALVFGASQPISVQTGLSLANASGYTAVSYSVDGKLIGSTTIGPDYLVTLDPTGFVAGAHQIQAQLALSADLSLTLVQQVMLASPELGIAFSIDAGNDLGVDPNHVTGSLIILAYASSDFGITSVSASLDGKSLGTLTAPNYCDHSCQLMTGGRSTPSDYNSYTFGFDTVAAQSGPHVLAVTATDGKGTSGEVIHQYTFNNPPMLTLTAPFDGALVNGSLTVSGTATSDKTGAITTVATLNGTQILSTTASPFSTQYSLTGLSPGAYTLTVNTTDASGLTDLKQASITVTSSPDLVYTPVIMLGPYGRVIAADGRDFVFRRVDNIARLHSGTNDVALPHTPAYTVGQSFLSNGNLFVTADNNSGGPTAVYMVAADGTLTSLSAAAVTGAGDALVAVHGPIVAFRNGASNSLINGGSSYTFYNVNTAARLNVPTPAGATGITASGDFYTTSSGNIVFFYPAITSTAPTTDIFRWDQATGQSTHVTNGSVAFQLGVQTDGQRAAWSSAPPAAAPFPSAPADLVSLDIASNTPTTVSNIALIPFQIRYLGDGLLAWNESSTGGGGIKVSDSANTATITARLSSVLFGTSSGYVLYEDQGALHVWSAAGGSKLIFDAVPRMAMISQKTVYFTNGYENALYQVTLQ